MVKLLFPYHMATMKIISVAKAIIVFVQLYVCTEEYTKL
jgi:hypothetical protein